MDKVRPYKVFVKLGEELMMYWCSSYSPNPYVGNYILTDVLPASSSKVLSEVLVPIYTTIIEKEFDNVREKEEHMAEVESL